jgi:serine/threonine protein kinase
MMAMPLGRSANACCEADIPLAVNREVVCPNKIGPYILGECLGKGGFSIVRLARRENSAQLYACKIVPFQRLAETSLSAQFAREIAILERCHHPGICPLVDFLRDTINAYVVLELCRSGDLRSLIRAEERLPEPTARHIFKQIAAAVSYLHSIRVVHRDLKPENILVDHAGMVKITDFGLSNIQEPDCLMSTHVGSPVYASPESLSTEDYDGFTHDIWSCGIVLFVMLQGRPPWLQTNFAKLGQEIRAGQISFPEEISDDAKDLILGMLRAEPAERMTWDAILEHSWLKEVEVPSQTEITEQPQLDRERPSRSLEYFVKADVRGMLARARRICGTRSIIRPTVATLPRVFDQSTPPG